MPLPPILAAEVFSQFHRSRSSKLSRMARKHCRSGRGSTSYTMLLEKKSGRAPDANEPGRAHQWQIYQSRSQGAERIIGEVALVGHGLPPTSRSREVQCFKERRSSRAPFYFRPAVENGRSLAFCKLIASICKTTPPFGLLVFI